MKKPQLGPKTIYLATILSLVAFGAGYAMAASFTISTGSETGNGNFFGTTNMVYWSESAAGVAATPSTVPTVLSTTVGTPTVLAGSASNYLVNAGTAGDVAHFLKFAETAAAPANTELEVIFTVSTGTTPTVTTVTSFIETQAIPAALTFTIYYDLGSAASASIVLNSVQQISQQCAAVGTCP